MTFTEHSHLLSNPRLVLEFDLLFFAFGKLGTVIWAWTVMFAYTLLVPYLALVLWGSLYHYVPSKLGLSLGTGLVLSATQTYVLGLFPIYAVIEHQLPPASRFIVILEQVSGNSVNVAECGEVSVFNTHRASFVFKHRQQLSQWMLFTQMFRFHWISSGSLSETRRCLKVSSLFRVQSTSVNVF